MKFRIVNSSDGGIPFGIEITSDDGTSLSSWWYATIEQRDRVYHTIGQLHGEFIDLGAIIEDAVKWRKQQEKLAVPEYDDDEEDYITKNGKIVAPGKFERETLLAPHFYNLSLDGNGEDVEELDGTATVFLQVQQEDVDKFPDLLNEGDVGWWARIHESSDGFVHYEGLSSESSKDEYVERVNLEVQTRDEEEEKAS